MIGAIARARGRIVWNTLRRPHAGRRRARARLIIWPVLLVAFGAPLFLGMIAAIRFGETQQPGIVRHYLSLIFSVTFLLVLFGNFPATLSALYFSPTVPLLLAAPVPLRAVFLTALAEGALAAPFILALSALALLAYAIGAGAGAAFFLVALIGLAALAVLVAALTQLLVVALLRVVPARRAKEGLTLLGAVISIGGYALWYGARGPSGGFDNGSGFQNVADRSEAYARWLPSGWAGLAAGAAQAGAWGAMLGWLLALLAGAAAITGAAYLVFQRAFVVGWSATRESAPRRRSGAVASAGARSTLGRIGFGAASPARAIAIKEIRTLVRDTKRLSVVVRSVGFTCIYLFFFLFRGGGAADGIPPIGSFWLRVLLAAMALIFGLANGVGGYAFGSEGAQFGLYRGAPLVARTLLAGKWLASVALVLPAALVLTLGIGLALRGDATQLALLPVIAIWYALGTTAVAVAAAAIGPQFAATQPNRATGPTGRLASAIGSVLFLGGSFVLWGGIALLITPRAGGFIGRVQAYPAFIAAALVGGGALAVGTVIGIIGFAQRRVRALLAPAA